MATPYKRSNGRYYAQFFDASKRPRQKQVSLKTRLKREALKRLSELQQAYEQGRYDPWDGSNPWGSSSGACDLGALQAATDAFIASRSNLSSYTVTKYRSVLGLLAQHLGGAFATGDIKPRHIQAFLDSGKRSAITKKTYSTTLSPFFNWLIGQGAIAANPVALVRLEKAPNKFPRYLTHDDVAAICAAIRARQQHPKAVADGGAWLVPIVQANVYLGLRAGELVNLTWEQIDFGRRTLAVVNTDAFKTKSGRGRVLPLCEPVLVVLQTLQRVCPYVFPNYGGTKLHRQYLSRAFKHYAVMAGLGHLNFHATRHTAASWLAQAGCSIEAIRRYMGHSSVVVTQKYMHLSEDGLAAQVEQAFMQ